MEMSSFEKAVDALLEKEGGYSYHPNDPGGPTNFGISLRFYKLLYPNATIENIQNMQKKEAIELYKKHFWDNLRIGTICNQEVATKILEMAVHMGAMQAIKMLQLCYNKIQGSKILAVDGLMGKMTAYAINNSNKKLLLNELSKASKSYYQKLANQNPKLQIFLKGWINRAIA